MNTHLEYILAALRGLGGPGGMPFQGHLVPVPPSQPACPLRPQKLVEGGPLARKPNGISKNSGPLTQAAGTAVSSFTQFSSSPCFHMPTLETHFLTRNI